MIKVLIYNQYFLLDISGGNHLSLSALHRQLTAVLLILKWMVLCLWKVSFKMLCLSFTPKLDWLGLLCCSFNKKNTKKVGALFYEFFSPEVIYCLAMHWILLSCLCNNLKCYLDILYNFQKQIFQASGPALSDSLEPLDHVGSIEPVALHHDLTGQSLLYRYYFGNAPLTVLC